MGRLVLFAFITGLAAAASAAEPWAPPGISSPVFESHPAFSSDGGEMLFVRSDANFTGWRLFQSTCRGGHWSTPAPPAFAADAAEADPFYAPDGRVYFISGRHAPDKQTDDLDIWSVARIASGWDEPVRLPAPVNSAGDEWFPRLTADGTLYFGSSRPGGLGLTDIYKATPAPGGGWTVSNLGAPINTARDEFEFEIARDGTFAILMGNRGHGGRLHRTERHGESWSEPTPLTEGAGFQVGALLSPQGDAVLFAEPVKGLSGEIVRLQLKGNDTSWPPRCTN